MPVYGPNSDIQHGGPVPIKDFSKKSKPAFGAAHISRDQREKILVGIERGLLTRAGLEREKPDREYASFSLSEIARECLRAANQDYSGRRLEMIGRALATTDLSSILGNVANKALFEGWKDAPETWPVWVDEGSLPDFKESSIAKISEASDLDEIPEEGEYHYGTRSDSNETIQLVTYGKLFGYSRQSIVNDDLNALIAGPKAHGAAAARKVGDVVYAVLTANGTMGDGVALFNAATHGNYVAVASGAAPGTATIGAGIQAMKTQTDLAGLRKLNIRPEYFIAPVALEGTAEVFFRSERFSDTDTIATDSSLASTRTNPYAGNYFTRVYDARLDDDSETAWYLAARKGRTVKVFFLDGVREPYVETRPGWSVDGIELKIRIDAVAAALDYRGLYCNEGT